MRIAHCFGIILLATLVAACATQQRASNLDETLRDYNTLIRWNEFDAAAEYYDPELRETQPLTRLDKERLAQFRISGYDPRSVQLSPDGNRATQSVEIRLYNVHSMTERVIVDRQGWRYDADAKRWWLTTGLPDVTADRGARAPRSGRQ